MADVDKALNQAPMGLLHEDSRLDPIEVEVILDGEEEVPPEPEKEDFNANLAEDMEEEVLTAIATTLLEDFDADISSRKDWIQTYVDGLDLLGLKIEERTEPWAGACGVHHPLLSEALVKFQAETMMETFPAGGPVKTQVLGEETAEKKEASVRVKNDMNYQLTERMVEYRPEHERMLWGLGLSGNAFKKVYFDPALNRQTAIFLPAEDVVVPYGASNLETSPRVTHVMRKTPNELRKLQANGFYLDVDLGEPTDTFDEIEKKIAEGMGFQATHDDRHRILEMHVEYDLPGHESDDGVALPYVVTIDKATTTILAIRRNWVENDEQQQKRNHFVHYSYVPGFGFYAFGLIHLIGSFAKSGTALIRQLVDAGTLSNLPGGFKTKGLRVKGNDTPIAPAEFRDVDVASGDIKDNIMTLPYKEPSQVLYSLLGTIIEEGRRFASAADMKVSDMSAQSPVGTTLAILERTLKVMSAVQARIHYSMRQEFRLLKEIIRDHAEDSYDYKPETGDAAAREEDYDMVEVIPVSDPNAATMAQKVVQYQAVLQLAQGAPHLYNMPLLHRQMLDVLGIRNASKLIPVEEDHKPAEPVAENMNILNSKPVKAFLYQDHKAHITVHMAAMQDPQIAQLVGQSPNAKAIAAAMSAHVAEHLAFEYRKRVEDMAGVPYPAPDAQMDEQTELEVSRLAAAAAQKVLQASQAQAAQEEAQQAAQDPVVQMQMKELAIKEQDSKGKQAKIATDAAAKADELRIKEEAIKSKERIEGLKIGAKIATDKSDQSNKQQAEGLRMGVDIAKEAAQQQERERDREANRRQAQNTQNGQNVQNKKPNGEN